MSRVKDSVPKSPLEDKTLEVPTASHFNLSHLITKRSSVKGRITKYKNYLNDLAKLDTISPIELGALGERYEKLRELFSCFDELQTQIEIVNHTNMDSELDVREEIELGFSTLIAQTQLFIERNKKGNIGHNESITSDKANHRHSCNHFKLPVIQISNFDGTYFKWLEFRDTYSSLIHNNDTIESIHKFHYLNSYLEGEASRVISNLEICSGNYSEAWRLLCDRYNNTKQLINNHLNSLCNIPPIHRETAIDLRFLIDHVSKNLRALKTLGEPTNSWDTLVVHLVSAKLHGSTNFKWEEYKNNFSQTPTLKDFFDFLKARADVLESVQNNKAEHSNYPKIEYPSSIRRNDKSQTKSFAVSAVDGARSYLCPSCNGSHRIYDCASFLAMSVKDRIAEAVQLRLCQNCLRRGHSPRQCRLGPCTVCKAKHNSLLHGESPQVANSSILQATISDDNDEVEQMLDDNIVSMSITTTGSVLLSTAQVEVFNPHNNKRATIRVLLDSGSQSSLITNRLKDKLNLTPQLNQVDILGVGNICSSSVTERCIVKIKSKTTNFETILSCLVLQKISGNLPNKSIDPCHIKIPSNITLADPSFNKSAPVDMLIGADTFWDLIESEQMHLGPNQPFIRQSKLGWILAGPMYTNKNFNSIQCNHLAVECSGNCISNEALNESLTKFWEMEQFPQSMCRQTDEDRDCEADFVKNTYRNNEGRFCVRLPLSTEADCLGDSFRSAKRQFLALEKRFVKSPELKVLYSNFIQEYVDLGHMSKANTSVSKQFYYIPHHAVWKPSSESTKLRVVFNGSAKTTSGYSVNDIQMVGPYIQDFLFNILLRFRQHSFVLTGDIKQMYRQVEMQDSHRHLQTILWRDNTSDPIQSFNLNTVTYGLSSSSFLSTRCLWQIGEECTDPKVKEVIQRDFLVDDLLTGTDDQNELVYIKNTVEDALASNCFLLRKYRSNLPSLLAAPQNTQCDLIISSSSHTLGVGWDPNEDYIHFPTSYDSTTENPTKRTILSDSCKLFDPLGLLSMFTIKPKILIQSLWVEKIGWDEVVPESVRRSWNSFVDMIKLLAKLRIPRHALCKSPAYIELHCFCDASQHAYAACVFLKSMNEQGETVRLLCAKTRVASVKPMTIPRLELCACLLGAKLAGAVCRALRCVVTRKVFWTDSSIVLCWLNTRFDRLKTFVANRVGSILEITNSCEWRHVPTDLNPADQATRGLDVDKLDKLDLWWNGPPFLHKPESSWPPVNPGKYLIDEPPEIKVNIAACDPGNRQRLIDFDKYSKALFLQRSFAYALRFINNCRNPAHKLTDSILQPEELRQALDSLVKLSQEDSFQPELVTLRSGRVLSSKKSLISLSPFLDERGILRVGGRLENSCYSYEKRHPMLLHAKHRLTKLLFQQEHMRLLHAGPQLLLSSLRRFIWPIAGRDLARTTARQCVVCRKASGKTPTPIMGMLPQQRVEPGYPFATTGVDFAGPFFITDRKGRGCKISKCYLCIFVCFRYKCLHLEAVSELSKDAFIASLHRFLSRRGKPSEIFCDNGRNFVAASREISDFVKSHADDIAGCASAEGIKFCFQPAYAPHFGGLWESAVKSAKYHLKRILTNTHLTFEELATLFSQIEAILNSRPICPLSPSPNDYSPLTPGHFLIGRPLTSLPAPNLQDRNVNRLNRFQRLEALRQHFWSRWQKEYVVNLQHRHKWRSTNKPMQEGDLVLLKEDNCPPMHWKLGRIVTLFPGQDGVARVAEIKTQAGTFRRGVKYLCPLLDPEEDTLESAASKAPENVQAHH